MDIPKCVAIIPDGNRRWARHAGLDLFQGYERGLQHFHEIVQAAFEVGVEHVVIWTASESNLTNRSPREVKLLFSLLERELNFRLANEDQGVRFYLRGNRRLYWDEDLLALIAKAEEVTAHCMGKHLTVLFAYNGLREMADAATLAISSGRFISIQMFRERCWNAHLPTVDLIIRTGVEDGDYHNSESFLPLHTENTQLIFSERLWPDFSVDDLHAAFADFARRPRRMGK